METERLDTRTAEGRAVAIWRSWDEQHRRPGPPVLLSAGFARHMRHVGSIALGLVSNGATVYRFDCLDHLGLSDGEIIDFSLGSMVKSLQATIEFVRRREDTTRVYLMTLSLATLAAYQLAAEDRDIARILSISGVVDGRRTLHEAIGADYFDHQFENLPAEVTVMGQQVRPHEIWKEHRETGCYSPEWTREQLRRIEAAVVNCVAQDDPWVDIESCDRAFTEGDGGERMIIRLPYSGHDLGRNPVAVTTILETMASLGTGEGSIRDAPASVRVPSFDELLENRVEERQRYMAERAATKVLAGEPSREATA